MMKECPKCGGQEISKGIQYNQGNIYPENKNMFKFGSEIVHVFCGNCGFIIESYVKNPEKLIKKSSK